MGSLNIFGKALEFAGKAIQRGDVGVYLKERAEALLNRQIEELALGSIKRMVWDPQKLAIKKITGEFEKIFENQTFREFMNHQWNTFDASVIERLVAQFVTYSTMSDDRFYAIPKFIILDTFSRLLRDQLNQAEGLSGIFESVFGKALLQDKKRVLIDFSCEAGATIGFDKLLKDAIPTPAGAFTGKLTVRKIGQHSYLLGVNPDLVWQSKSAKGHLYLGQRQQAPEKSDLEEIGKLKAKLEAQLLRVGAQKFSDQLLQEIRAGSQISSETREKISIK